MKNRAKKPRTKAKPNPRRTALKADPTRTSGARRRFAAAVKRKFRLLRRLIVELVVGEDAFGLKPRQGWQPPKPENWGHVASFNEEGQPSRIVFNDRWRFRTSSEKVKEFQAWLRKQFGTNLTGLDERELWRRYIEDGYKRGAGRAWDDANPKAKAKGKAARSMDFYQGTREQFLRSAFGRPETEEKVKLLVGRAFDDLEGVTEDMGRRMSRVLADGLVRGAHPNEVARALADEVDIGETRATLIARTEFLRAHNEAALDSMQSMGMEEVGVAVEWEVTEDEKLCPRCEAMRGVILKIDEARGMLPLHPLCRCSWTPANVGEDNEGQKRSKGEIEAAAEEADVDLDVSGNRPRSIL